MTDAAAAEARKALNRLRSSVEKALRELSVLEGALARAESEDFPRGIYARARSQLTVLLDFTDEEARRLQEKILHAGGLEPGRMRRGRSR